MNQDELQTLLDISSSSNLTELKRLASIRLSNLQIEFAQKGYYDGSWKDKETDLERALRSLNKG